VTRVAFQGEPGAYGWEAVQRYWGENVEPVPHRSFQQVFLSVASGSIDAGLVPIENSQAGSINEVYDLLRQHDLFVTGEIVHPVNHCLLALPGQTIGSITRVISHPQALAQVDEYLRQLGVEAVATYDTAGSAKMIRDGALEGVAAVAGAGAAQLYGLEILAANIQTVQGNYTRFIAVGRAPEPRKPGPSKTMLVMATAHRPGSLYRAMGALAQRSINLLKLESRPSRNRPWEYVFYLDFEGHREDPAVREALAELAEHTVFCKVLGSFLRDTAEEGNGRPQGGSL
jgi:prephenate dehydratase